MRRREQRNIARPIPYQIPEVIDASIGACSNQTSATLYSKYPLKKMPALFMHAKKIAECIYHEKHKRHEIESFRAFRAFRG